jgi:hypothetical protein
LPTLTETRIDVSVLRSLVLGLAPDQCPDAETLTAMLARHRGNAREVFFELYDAAETAYRSA